MNNNDQKDKSNQNPRTIESELPEAKYIKNFNKSKESYYRTIRIHLTAELPKTFNNYKAIQELLVKNEIPIDRIKKTSYWLLQTAGMKYEGQSEKFGTYDLESHVTAEGKERLELNIFAYIDKATQLPNLISVIKNYTIKYEQNLTK
jgi:hypothetical protein